LKNNTIIGILVTIVIHLVAGIIFFTVKITGFYTQQVQIKVETPEVIKQEQAEELEKLLKEKERMEQIIRHADALIAAQKRRNIGVNVADNNQQVTEKDLLETQQEIENAKNQISSIEENLEKQKEKVNIDNGNENLQPEKKVDKKAEGKLAVYKGPTNIYYNLPNRHDIYLYIPVYKCPGSGKVIIDIAVDNEGNVVDAKIDKTGSDNDPCLHDAAYDAALKSRFNNDNKAPKTQRGTITYIFISQ